MIKYIKNKNCPSIIYKLEDNHIISNGNKIQVDIERVEQDYIIVDTIEELIDAIVI